MIKFETSELTPTKWSTVEDKVAFIRQFETFVDSGFSFEKFPRWFYTPLSMCFGMTAHYNHENFWHYYNSRGWDKFMKDVTSYPCYGSPEFTFSDAEKIIVKHYKKKKK